MDQLTSNDMEFIIDSLFPSIDKEIVTKMVAFSNRVSSTSTIAPLKETQETTLSFYSKDFICEQPLTYFWC